MRILLKLLLLSSLFINSVAMADELDDMDMPKGTLLMLAPPVVNKKYFNLEFGFLTEKEFKPWSYEYNAYVTAAVFQDSYKRNDNLKTAGLGFKGGVFLPTQKWVPLLATLSIGYAKTALHKNPIFGKEESSKDKKNMFLLEVGALYYIDKKYFIRYAYQLSNVKYIKTHSIIMLGVDY
ncbi:hypothetical protein C0V70_11910 [Bacteriovorax stolpii]|uniref:Uncharacterized protein n=1 Tax=Bacteriovorax stolpii TaxID=960 RepID=A0A2K9NTH0_BACTC|nr:hypothetical protein [Bacteriovorax stolpii]AUN98792.1 hypothetical protein C0V70_11910 [Bacteriovorax stolpii]TDP55690.1 hypothetical protein C8D79_0745 [Bacteriovorax stolpii]